MKTTRIMAVAVLSSGRPGLARRSRTGRGAARYGAFTNRDARQASGQRGWRGFFASRKRTAPLELTDVGDPQEKYMSMARKHFGKSLVSVLALIVSASVAADDAPVTTQIVDAMNKMYGAHPGFRANHAKGVVVEGSFKASPGAAQLSRASLFDGRTIPVTVRFSDTGGLPNVPDGSADANPHGMAIKFHLPGGADTDMVIVSLKFFLVGTGEEFRDLLLAIIASPADAPKPTKFDQFTASHPSVLKALATVSTPDSFADEEYYGLDAFIFVAKDGRKQAVRYVMVPEKVVHLTPEEGGRKSPDFLIEDLPRRIAQKPVVFHLNAQLAAPGDQTKDPSQPWPDTRKVVELGVLTLDKPVADSLAAQKKLLFMPTQLTDGIELSDDPLPVVRAGAYAVSFSRRQ
jgi:catalase